MKERKLTLLIALSIIITATIGMLIIPFSLNNNAETSTDVTATPIDIVTTTNVTSTDIVEENSSIVEEKTSTVKEKTSAPKTKVKVEQKNTAKQKTSSATKKPAAADTPTSSSKNNTTSSTVKLPSGKYPEAQLIWDTMRSWGWSPETCAGIIGNMMAEVGGGTLNLSNWDSNGGCGYGLIQWTGSRRTAIKNRYGSRPTIQQQLTFMKDELFGTNNTRQQVGSSSLAVIMNSNGNQTPESVAYCFASYYERCGSAYRAQRRGYARTAYNYFMSK